MERPAYECEKCWLEFNEKDKHTCPTQTIRSNVEAAISAIYDDLEDIGLSVSRIDQLVDRATKTIQK